MLLSPSRGGENRAREMKSCAQGHTAERVEPGFKPTQPESSAHTLTHFLSQSSASLNWHSDFINQTQVLV